MFLVVHVLLGALIGLQYNSLFLVVVFSFVSHYLLDVIPHWDSFFDHEYFKKNFIAKINFKSVLIVVLDFFLAVGLSFVLYSKFNSDFVLVGALVSIVPDLLKLGYFTPLKKIGLYKRHLIWHAKIQREAKIGFGLFTQVVTVALLYWALSLVK